MLELYVKLMRTVWNICSARGMWPIIHDISKVKADQRYPY